MKRLSVCKHNLLLRTIVDIGIGFSLVQLLEAQRGFHLILQQLLFSSIYLSDGNIQPLSFFRFFIFQLNLSSSFALVFLYLFDYSQSWPYDVVLFDYFLNQLMGKKKTLLLVPTLFANFSDVAIFVCESFGLESGNFAQR